MRENLPYPTILSKNEVKHNQKFFSYKNALKNHI